MSSQSVKKTSPEFDENKLWKTLILMDKHYRNHPTRGQDYDLREIIEILSNTEVNFDDCV